MPDFTPHYGEGPISYTAGAAITGGQVVEITGNMTVSPTAGASTKVVGVALRDVASGAQVAIADDAVFDLTATGAIAAGDQIVSAANGTVATVGAGTAFQVIGVALEAIANGATGRGKLNRI